jgi:hypothetical protein
MNVLFGDTFYHNIIYHLSPLELSRLICTCTHYRDTIPKYMKNITIHNIQKKLQKKLGNNYKTLKEQFKTLKCNLIELKGTDTWTYYNKYFFIALDDDDEYNCSVTKFHFTKSFHENVTISGKEHCIRTYYMHIWVGLLHSIFKCVLIHDDEDIAMIKKEMFKTSCAKSGNMFWIENNNNNEIFDFAQCL